MEEAVLLPVDGGWLSGEVHFPRQPPQGAVVVCAPLCEERKSSLRPLVELSRRLARDAGCAVLRFDYRGSGDSSGDFASHTPEDWQHDIRTAAAWLAERHPGVPQVWLGVRIGAALAQAAAALPGGAPPGACVWWEPVTGGDFVRQLLQRRMVNDMLAYGRARVSRSALEAQLQSGDAVDLDGYRLTSRLHHDLLNLPLPALAGPCLAVGTGVDMRALEAFRNATPQTEARQIRMPPFWSAVGQVDTTALTEATCAWLAGVLPRVTAAPARARAAGATGLSEAPTERPVTIDAPDGRIRGVLHRPGGDRRSNPVLFLHGWSGDRQGPHRLFVDLARRLAETGHASLRIDFRGRGESDGETAAASIAGMVEDARAAIAWLAAQEAAPGPITLVAICSGCKVAIAAAASASGIGRLVLWSPESMGSLRDAGTNRRKTLAALRGYGRRLLRRETWRKLLAGQVRADMVGKALVRHETRSEEEARQEDRVLKAFEAFGGDVLLVFGGSDPDAAGSRAAYTSFCRRHAIRHAEHTIAHAGHSYYGAEWRDELLALTVRWLASDSTDAARDGHSAARRLPQQQLSGG